MPKQLELTANLGAAYAFLLSLDKTGQAPRIELPGIITELKRKFKDRAPSLYTALKQKGLIVRPKAKPGERGPNGGLVLRKEYVIKGQAAPITPPKPAAKKTVAAPPTPSPAKIAKPEDEIAALHEFFIAHQATLDAAKINNARLRELGYEIVVHQNEPLLRRTKEPR